ncbi:F-box/kelch-repeat protein At1g23390-like [Benincasa hispida]|uniref:F-box/kelch-repeat protein At1g23390-like n=1 Tax=Benincasa hispida TaxID=102211 RepID=UPI0018FF5197|nr:F-box/kelch-repeat protein At1g23390-like [Benincasa hispida]
MSEKSEECGIGGDILEEIISHVPLVDLVSANTVSSSWRSAISASLLRLNTLKPWLIIHSQSTRSPSAVTTFAYDPRSNLWMELQRLSSSSIHTNHYFSLLRSFHSSLLYMLSPSRFAFSMDPLHLNWQHAPPPIGWRPDPVVTAVGNYIIVAGSRGCGGIPDDSTPPLEIYDATTGTWEWCDSMPTDLMESAASTWLSVAADPHKMCVYVSVKSTGVTYSFDAGRKTWGGPYKGRGGDTDEVFFSVIGCGGKGKGMIVVGLRGEAEEVRSVVMWRLVEIMEEGGREEWEMPFELVEKLKGESGYMPSICLNVMGDFVFVNNPSEGREVIMCELKQGECRWESLTVAMCIRDSSCSNVTLPHLERAFNLGTLPVSLKTLPNSHK